MSRCRTLLAAAALGAAIAPAATADARTRHLGDRTLARGMRGHDVRVLQDFLTRVGVRTTVDGRFGPRTQRRVRRWERGSARRADGRVTRSDARLLRRQVGRGLSVLAPRESAAPAAGEQATLGEDGLAIPPASAPPEVQAVIAAANEIVGTPYKYGGGHARWRDSGYDCSGSESYALHGGGFVDSPLTSSGFMRWGEPGPGTWITSYANGGHSFLVVAGLRFDTGYNDGGSGPRWSERMRPRRGYTVRHPDGF